MKKIISIMLLSGLIISTFAGCSSGSSSSGSTKSGSSSESSDKTAGEKSTAPEIDLGTENLTPIYGDELKDGVYEITADSSSSMFKITGCELTVENGKMTAVMTMSGTGYLYLFMGKGEDADESGYIPFAENENGEHTFTVPVEALDMAIECSAFSKKKNSGMTVHWCSVLIPCPLTHFPLKMLLQLNPLVLKTVNIR